MLAGDDGLVVANLDGEGGQLGLAGEDVAADGAVFLGALNVLVVVLDDGVVDQDEGRAGVCCLISYGVLVWDGLEGRRGGGKPTSNTGNRVRVSLSIANGISVSRELPETLGGVDVSVGDLAGVLALVDEAEVVATGGMILQGDGEEGLVELGLDGVEEGGLRLRLDGVDLAECQAQQAVVVLVLRELLADLAGGLDGLAVGVDAANSHGVLVDVAAGGAAVAVGDVPAGALDLGGVAGGLVDAVAGFFGRGEFLGEDPPVFG